ncbi:helix-turn-helix transcriptional regulator [Natrarchaeobius oligotrophus]|uniref:Transcriptional regulator n=1 Tax=Natrarchaeobius chitinivorans TaxID=1679083 RepID=A0A3N6MZB2_NATCH|nr:transcriptional regulator [Natrarchaeobius chitinivorans]RQH01862.1 transcriptional regulator [Natrarchaeobius chitinivorans]
MGSSIDEIAFIASSTHRVRVLDALAEGGCDRRDLRSMTGAHASTVGRVLGDFEERRWIERDGRTYELTPLGEFVAERFANLRGAMELETQLRDVWQWLPREMEGFSVELFTDAVVASLPSGYPYEPVERVVELVEGSDSIRGFGATVFKAAANEVFCREAIEGMDVEFIYSPSVLAATVDWNPDRFERAAASDRCTIFVHDDLPDRTRCGVDIFDDRVAICCHDAETRDLRAWVDTAAPEAREWALSVFRRCRKEARPVDEAALAVPVPEEFTTP